MIHRFDDPAPLDGATARRWLGGKGASLAWMTQMELPVPPGFTLSTEVWRHFERHGELPDGLEARIREEVARLEARAAGGFGDAASPLLLAVRSGGPTSMPGMLATVLDVGIDAAIAEGLGSRRGGVRFGLDVRRRFVESYSTVVLGVPRPAFDALLGRREVSALDESEIARLLSEMEALALQESGEPIPSDPWEQLLGAIRGVLRSWKAPRATKYREAHGIADEEGTAVTLQAMVFGNLDERSGAGVVFSRNPSTGERELYGEWLPRGQGEDVVGGRITPQPLTRAQVRRGMEDTSLELAMPEVLAELRPMLERLERRYCDAVDVEITIEDGRLFVLQCRSAKRTARAAARIAVEMANEGGLDRRAALGRVEPGSLRQLLTPRLPEPDTLSLTPLARGLGASPGAATGRIVFDSEGVRRFASEEMILVRAETSAEDVEVMRVVAGILTAAGGLTSHAAVVARAMGKPCVTGATSLHIDYVARRVIARPGGRVLEEGDIVTIDGARGLVYDVPVVVEPAPASPHVETILAWADEARKAKVFAEASSPRHALIGRSFGADGVAGSGDVTDLLAAVGDGHLLLRVRGREAIGAAIDALRPETDHLWVDPEELEAARHLRADRALRLWVDEPGAEGADGYVVQDAEALARVPAGVAVAFRANETRRALTRAALSEVREVILLVPPLDVPVGRLLAAQVGTEP